MPPIITHLQISNKNDIKFNEIIYKNSPIVFNVENY